MLNGSFLVGLAYINLAI